VAGLPTASSAAYPTLLEVMGNVRSEQTALFFYVRWLAAHVLLPAAWESLSMSTVPS
jgi:hypothetical protein